MRERALAAAQAATDSLVQPATEPVGALEQLLQAELAVVEEQREAMRQSSAVREIPARGGRGGMSVKDRVKSFEAGGRR